MMPVTDRIKMLRGIKNDFQVSHIPMVMLTTGADISTKLSGVEKGDYVYLLIPFNKIDLKAVLRNLTGIGHKLKEHPVSVTLSEINDRTEPYHNDQFIQKIHCLMDAHIDDDQFGITELCYAIGMSRAQVYRKFRSLTEKTLHDYLRSYRLQRAKELLLTTKLNVSEVSYLTGFKNVSHFSRIFAEEFGKNPSEL
jgi:AraC-like DNA-binding protein